MSTSLPCVLLLAATLLAEPPPRTVAEKSDYKATSLQADVAAFGEALAKQSKAVKLSTLGTTHEGRPISMLVVADPPVAAPADVKDRTVVLLLGNIHAGEVDGKEALLMLARDLATGKNELLKDLVLLIVPNFNADGNEKLGKHRPLQNGPVEVGTRANAQKLDLNRDFVKLASPEVRGLVRTMNAWNPSVFIDLHSTNGSYHRYLITYDGPRHPSTDPRLVNFARSTLLPDVGKRLEKQDKVDSFFYGDFSKDHKRWESYPPLPRFGIVHAGLSNRIGILCESYMYAPFAERVRGSKAFVLRTLESIVAHKSVIRTLLKEARDTTVAAGNKPRADSEIVLRFNAVPFKEPVTVRGFVEEMKGDKVVPTDKPRDYQVDFWGDTKPLLSVVRPYAYLYPPALKSATETLQRQGVNVEELREDIELDVESYALDKLTRAMPAPYLRDGLLRAETKLNRGARRIPAGTLVVRTGQSLGTLAAFLLEPQSDDGLLTWGLLGDLKEASEFPILRLPQPVALTLGPARPLRESVPPKKPIQLDAVINEQLPNFSGPPVSALLWYDDEHFLQVKGEQLLKVHAVTGRATPFLDHDKLARCLAAVPGLSRGSIGSPARFAFARMNKPKDGILLEANDDLWFCPFNADKPVRLTKTPGRKELITLSPDGKHAAFVRASNLYVVDIATQTEKQLTKDGSNVVFNGKAGWVYFEEIFSRQWIAFWWSPDSKSIAFFRTDEAKLKKFTVLDQIPIHQYVEETPYPKAGDPNPLVKLGVVSIDSGSIRWAPQGDLPPEDVLISRVGWTPDNRLYYYLQDRQQTWLDFRLLDANGKATTLFRDKTKAWIEDPGAPVFLKEGSFLWLSERSGWKHLYLQTPDGKPFQAVTSGDWEVRQLLHVDADNDWLYFVGTKDSHVAQNLYRVRLDGSELTRLTRSPGDHLASPRFGPEPPSPISPRGSYFIDTWSDNTTPARVGLFRTDGSLARTLDTNPVHVRDDYQFLPWETMQIRTPDGFLLEGMVLLPPKLDPKRKYPVWVKTYGGPHAPTIRDSWQGGRVENQALAQLGYIVFLVDPRSASGKGAVSTWTCYKQLGVQELKDMETAVTWLCQRPYVDAQRIGLSGHSYGGFLTAFALTRSKLFAAGVAGAPVTDWQLYDTIYTERYMLTPKENKDGYAKTSLLTSAKDLHGKLLLLHGNMDDNVHVQNTLKFADALQRADRDFEMMIYPRARHPIFGKHYRRLSNEFMQKALKP